MKPKWIDYFLFVELGISSKYGVKDYSVNRDAVLVDGRRAKKILNKMKRLQRRIARVRSYTINKEETVDNLYARVIFWAKERS